MREAEWLFLEAMTGGEVLIWSVFRALVFAAGSSFLILSNLTWILRDSALRV
jgi:hypothetical protein